MKNIHYTIGAKCSNTFDNILNKVFDCVGASFEDRSFDIKEDIINQVLDRIKTQIYEKY